MVYIDTVPLSWLLIVKLLSKLHFLVCSCFTNYQSYLYLNASNVSLASLFGVVFSVLRLSTTKGNIAFTNPVDKIKNIHKSQTTKRPTVESF